MNKHELAKNINRFLEYDLDNYIYSTGMQREWILTLKEDSLASYLNRGSISSDTRNMIRIVYSVAKAFQGLSDTKKHPFKKILALKYFDGFLPSQQIADEVGYCLHTYYLKKNDALLEFYKAFISAQQYYKVFPVIYLDNGVVDAESTKKALDTPKMDNLASFLSSLTYWQTVNLYITLLQARSDISFMDAKKQALANCSNRDKLEHLLDESLNSPNPKQINYSTSSN